MNFAAFAFHQVDHSHQTELLRRQLQRPRLQKRIVIVCCRRGAAYPVNSPMDIFALRGVGVVVPLLIHPLQIEQP